MLLHAPCLRRAAFVLLCGLCAAVVLARAAPAQVQVENVAICCEIIAIDGVNQMLYAKYTDSGRVFQVRVSAEDIKRVRIGDTIGAKFAQGGAGGAVVTQVAGATRTYTAVTPLADNWTPNDAFASAAAGSKLMPGVSPNTGKPVIKKIDLPQPDSVIICCVMVPNTELKGATGRLQVEAIKGVANFLVGVYKAGTADRAADWYGNGTKDLLPGRYDVVVNGVKLENVAIDRRSDTKIRLGALAINLTGNAHWEVHDVSRANRHTDGYGSKTIALPVGKYSVTIAGGVLEVEIKEGQVTTI